MSLCYLEPISLFSYLLENESLRQDFATKANTAGAYIDAKNTALSEINLRSQGTLEEQLQNLKTFQDEVNAFLPNIEACEACNQENQAAMVFNNPHTRYTIEVSSSTPLINPLDYILLMCRL